MKSIKTLHIEKNPFKKLPSGARKLAGAELLKYLSDAAAGNPTSLLHFYMNSTKQLTPFPSGSTSCVQTKLIVVGQEAVGKTTLLRNLNKSISSSGGERRNYINMFNLTTRTYNETLQSGRQG